MRLKFLIILSALTYQVGSAQDGSALLVPTPVAPANTVSPAPSTPVTPPPPPPASILDYKSVYEAASLEEEVTMATERFKLTPSQKDVWQAAAVDRREAEKQVREKLDSKDQNYDKHGMYGGLRSAHNTFYETVIGHLTPTQKQDFETDRLILQEKQKKLAKLPPPAPTATVAPVDSSAIKEAGKEKGKGKGKKSKKKRITAG